LGLPVATLDEEVLVQAAVKATGLTEFGRPGTILVLEYMLGNFWRVLVAPSATIEGHILS
jgi:hypothetical protein